MEKILVIEDDAAVQRALRRTFETAGFDVAIASDGAMAMETFRATMPRIVILDLRLPGKSGQDICREIKQECSSVPILVLSAASDVLDKVLLLELGADDYVTKPFSPRELLGRRAPVEPGFGQDRTVQLRRRGSKFLQNGVTSLRTVNSAYPARVQDAAFLSQ